ncbi:hypothetical protein FACS1894158_05480 [Betaproteobacteria bacterium]|nr:hypothetical protein FACS1894158_05480 [Betaproteobacteria bacterium]
MGITSRMVDGNAHEALARVRQWDKESEHFPGDLSKTVECERLVEKFVARFGGVDVLVNNAGGMVARKPLAEIDDSLFEQVIDLNARSAVMVTKNALPHLIASARSSGMTASVILVGSIAGYTGGGNGASLYAASKAWLHAVQKNWVNAHTKDGVRFNVVAPGVVDTAFHAGMTETTRASTCAAIPMGRLATAEEIAPSFLFLASHACSGYITGQIINVNGGRCMP